MESEVPDYYGNNLRLVYEPGVIVLGNFRIPTESLSDVRLVGDRKVVIYLVGGGVMEYVSKTEYDAVKVFNFIVGLLKPERS